MFEAAVSMEHVCKHVSIHVPSVHFKGHNVDLERKFKLRFFYNTNIYCSTTLIKLLSGENYKTLFEARKAAGSNINKVKQCEIVLSF